MGPGIPLETTGPISFRSSRLDSVSKQPIDISRYTPDYQLPEAPQGPLRAEILRDSKVDLSWRAPIKRSDYSPYRHEGAVSPAYPDKYIIEATLADHPNSPWLEVGTVPGSTTRATVRLPSPSLFSPTEHFDERQPPKPLLYRVRAENQFGFSAPLTVRLRPDLELDMSFKRLPVLPDMSVQARLLEPRNVFSEGSSPSLEITWPTYEPSSMTLPRGYDSFRPNDYSYLVEFRPVGELGWRHLSVLPHGLERFVFHPALPRHESPKSDAFQFRVAVKGPHGVGNYRESNVVSWLYGDTSPSRSQSRAIEPFSSTIRAPEDFRFEIPRYVPPTTSRTSPLTPGGAVTLRWKAPEMKTPISSFLLERWTPDTGSWKPVSYHSQDLGHGLYETNITHLPTDQPHFFRISTDTPLGTSEPAILSFPLFLPTPLSTKPGKR